MNVAGALAVMQKSSDLLPAVSFQTAQQLTEARAAVEELIDNNAEGKRQWDRVAKALGADPDCVDSVFAKADAVAPLVKAAKAVTEADALSAEEVKAMARLILALAPFTGEGK